MARTGNIGEHTYPAKRRVTVVGAAANAVLAIGKVVGGVIGQSQALVVDGVHSFSDLASDALVLWAARMGSLAADHNHPYGHERFETAATLGIGALLLLIAGGFAYDALVRLARPALLGHPGWLALSVAALSVAIKEMLYHYTRLVAARYRSELLRANAWHHRSDALSSVVVIVGVAGAMAGAPRLDALAALVVALMVGMVGWQLSWNAARELVDTGLEPEKLRTISTLIDSVDGVCGHTDLRTRKMAAATLVDVCVQVPADISVSEGRRIRSAVVARVRDNLPHVSEVFVRVDPRSWDEDADNPALPLRPQVEGELRAVWAPVLALPAETRLVLHYRGGRVDVDVILAEGAPTGANPAGLRAELERAAASLGYVGRVNLLYRA